MAACRVARVRGPRAGVRLQVNRLPQDLAALPLLKRSDGVFDRVEVHVGLPLVWVQHNDVHVVAAEECLHVLLLAAPWQVSHFKALCGAHLL